MQEPQQTLAISQVLDRYLKTIGELYFITARQLTRRFYKPGMFTTVEARLKQLKDAGYLHCLHLPTVKSKAAYIYALSPKGLRYVRAEGMEIEVYYKPQEIAELSHSFLWHVLALNDFLIAAKRLEQDIPGVSVARLFHDLSLRKKPILLPAQGTNKEKPVIPDSFLDMRVKEQRSNASRQYCFWVELDRGTEQTRERFKEKIKRIVLALTSGRCQAYFAIPAISAVAFVTTAGDKRVEQMRKWTYETLKEQNSLSLSSLFLFTAWTTATEPYGLFCEPRWSTPVPGQQPVSLLGD